MSKLASAAARKRNAPSSPPREFKRGERVRFTGAGKDWIGVVVESSGPEGRKSIHPRHDDTMVYVKFAETGVTIPVSMQQLQRLSDRRRS